MAATSRSSWSSLAGAFTLVAVVYLQGIDAEEIIATVHVGAHR